MGQYYNPSILKKNWKTAKNPVVASLKCYDFNDNGAKLMEHSYVGNSFVHSVEFLLANAFKGYPFVWVGDYADHVKTKTGEHDIYSDAGSFIYRDYYGDDNRKSKQYEALRATIPAMPKWVEGKKWNPYETIPYYRYLVNYTKKQFCIMPKYSEKEWRINPLPLLTCSGNGRGGGDFHDYDDERVGMWAYDRIGLTNSKKEIAGFEEVDGHFVED